MVNYECWTVFLLREAKYLAVHEHHMMSLSPIRDRTDRSGGVPPIVMLVPPMAAQPLSVFDIDKGVGTDNPAAFPQRDLGNAVFNGKLTTHRTLPPVSGPGLFQQLRGHLLSQFSTVSPSSHEVSVSTISITLHVPLHVCGLPPVTSCSSGHSHG